MTKSTTPIIRLPFGVGIVHFVGIGGIGMSGIAEVMHNLGYQVQGSDLVENEQVRRLQKKGIKVCIGHKPENIDGASALVISTAVKRTNPEAAAARAKHIPVVRRADMLSELMRLKWNVCIAGTHGKTTTTSMVAALLDSAGLDPTVINGGVINAYGTNARRGSGDWMVVEADESDGTFIRLPTTVGVITNIDPEHLDHYGSFENLRSAFDQFIENIPFYGFGVVCLDHPEVQALIGRVTDRRLISYGRNPQADVRVDNIAFGPDGSKFDIVFRERGVGREISRIADVKLTMPGNHNVLNAVAAAIVARELGATDDDIRTGFAEFGGVIRRFSKVGEVDGVTIIDDYGHHPVEISAVLQATRQVSKDKVVAIIQPHRYTRLRDLFDDFCACVNDADTVFIADVYAAGEAPIDGIDGAALAAGIRKSGHRDVHFLPDWQALPGLLKDKTSAGDYIVFLGAGDITKYANEFEKKLRMI